MELIGLEASNFRSLKSVTVLFGRITVLIGENDAGKSSVLDLLDLALGSKRPDDNDFFCCEQDEAQGGQIVKAQRRADFIEAILHFRPDAANAAVQGFAYQGIVKIRKRWTQQNVETSYWGAQIADGRLNRDFGKLKKPEQEELIQQIDPEALHVNAFRNADERVAWLERKAAEGPRQEVWIPVQPRALEFLPRFERYRAMDYSSPDTIVMKTLRQVYEQVIFEPVEQDAQARTLDRRLREVKTDAERKIREKVQELLAYIRRYSPQIRNVSFDPHIDFTSGLQSGEFQIDDGRGLHYLSKTGDGTKRRIFMATLDWDRQVSIEQAQQRGAQPVIVRGYDEPDTNLHYEAQRAMYRAIADIADTPQSHIQAILCTHSLTIIDRAPAKSLNLLKLMDGCTQIERLVTDDDPEVELFLAGLAQELGITNAIMFYEKCFILVEGDTEENALPALYRNLYGRSMLEDGIRLINTKSNGAVKEFLRLLSRNRQKLTVILVDTDTKYPQAGKTAKLTEDALRQAGFSAEFIVERLRYVGVREFEDAFSDDCLAKALQKGYPRKDASWQTEHIQVLRRNVNKKFSDELKRVVFEDAQDNLENKWGKPEFGKHLGQVCKAPDEIPQAVHELFRLARHIAGC